MATRKHDWVICLDSYLLQNKDAKFSYDAAKGLDCCTFTFGAIEAQTGIDIGAQFRGRYTTERGSLRVIRDYCGSASLEAGVTALFAECGFHEVLPLMAHRGDPVLLRHDQGVSLGIVALDGRHIISISHGGLLRLPLSHAIKAWHLS